MFTKDLIIKIVGALAALYAFAPLIYSRFDNVKNTGNDLTDAAAEGVHDFAMVFLTFYTGIRAIVAYIVLRIIISLIPESVFAEKAARE